MTTFTFPLPSHVTEITTSDKRIFPDPQIVGQVNATWAGRAPLPAGGFDALVTVPALTGNTRDGMHEGVALFVYRTLWAAGVLNSPPAILGVRFQAGNVATPEVLVTMAQLQWPDGSPAVLPREETQCAAC